MAYLIRRREDGGYRVRYAKAAPKEPPAGANCGTGSGGFKPGNKCGLKGGPKAPEAKAGPKTAKAEAAPAPKAKAPAKPAAAKAPAPAKPAAASKPAAAKPAAAKKGAPPAKPAVAAKPKNPKTIKKSPIPNTPKIGLYDVKPGGTMTIAGVEIKPTGNSYMEATMDLLAKKVDMEEVRKAVLSVFVSRQIDPSKRAPKKTTSRPQTVDSEKSRRARAAAVSNDKEVTQYAEAQEFKMAMALGKAIPMPDNEEMDLLVASESGSLHGVEMKTVVSRKEHKVQMSAEAVRKKQAWSDKTGHPIHTVLLDHRDKYGKGKYKHLHSGHELYYKRGVGTISLGSAYKCKDIDELKKLMELPDDKLPPLARPTKRS